MLRLYKEVMRQKGRPNWCRGGGDMVHGHGDNTLFENYL